MEYLKKFIVEERGQGMTEYALILGLVVLGIWVAIATTGIGTEINAVFTRVVGAMQGCTSGSCP